MGDVYFRYPSGLSQTEFALYLVPQGVEVDSDGANAGNFAAIRSRNQGHLAREAIKLITENNTWQVSRDLVAEAAAADSRISS